MIIIQKKKPARTGTELLPAVFLCLYFFRRTDEEEGREDEEEPLETDDPRLPELEADGRLTRGVEDLEFEDELCLLMVDELLLVELVDPER